MYSMKKRTQILTVAVIKKVYSKLQGYANELMRNGYEAVSIEMPWGEVFEEITRVGDDKEVDLTLVASHGKGFF